MAVYGLVLVIVSHRPLPAVAGATIALALIAATRPDPGAAMRRLADGKTDDAHQLWQKVLDTRMFSFFEFEMASRYLRLGAPTTPPVERVTTETI